MNRCNGERVKRMSTKSRKLIWNTVRIAVCAVALGWVLLGVTWHDYVQLNDGRRPRLILEEGDSVTIQTDQGSEQISLSRIAVNDLGQARITYGLVRVVRQSDAKLLVLCLVVFCPVPFLQSLRFLWLLRAQEIHISYWESVKLSFAGNFLNFVAPGTTGGDVIKAYYITLHTHQKTEAVTTVFLDRIAGLAGILGLVSIVIFATTGDAELRGIGYIVLAMLLALGLGCLLLLSEGLRRWVASRRLATRVMALAGREQALPADSAPSTSKHRLKILAGTIIRQAQRADQATQRLLKHRKMVLGALAATLVLQFFAVSAFVLICRAVGMNFTDYPAGDYYAVTATGNIVAAIPISPQGLGTTEAVFKHFLEGSHANLSQVLCMAMGIRLMQLSWALPGILVTMTGAYTPKMDSPESQDSQA